MAIQVQTYQLPALKPLTTGSDVVIDDWKALIQAQIDAFARWGYQAGGYVWENPTAAVASESLTFATDNAARDLRDIKPLIRPYRRAGPDADVFRLVSALFGFQSGASTGDQVGSWASEPFRLDPNGGTTTVVTANGAILDSVWNVIDLAIQVSDLVDNPNPDTPQLPALVNHRWSGQFEAAQLAVYGDVLEGSQIPSA